MKKGIDGNDERISSNKMKNCLSKYSTWSLMRIENQIRGDDFTICMFCFDIFSIWACVFFRLDGISGPMHTHQYHSKWVTLCIQRIGFIMIIFTTNHYPSLNVIILHTVCTVNTNLFHYFHFELGFNIPINFQ